MVKYSLDVDEASAGQPEQVITTCFSLFATRILENIKQKK